MLLRLELEGNIPGGLLKERWREVIQLYEGHIEGSDSNLFYDFHALMASLQGEEVQRYPFMYDFLSTFVSISRHRGDLAYIASPQTWMTKEQVFRRWENFLKLSSIILLLIFQVGWPT